MSSDPDSDPKSYMRESFELRDTDELIRIWKDHDLEEWTVEALSVIEEIIRDRLGELPSQYDDALDPEGFVQFVNEQLLQAYKLLDDGEFEKSLDICTSILKLNPDHAEAHHLLGLVLLDMDRTEDAIAAFRNAIRLDWVYGEARSNMKLAQEIYREEIEETPAQQHLNQAQELVENNDIEKALQECRLAVELNPEFSVAFNYLGMIYQHLGRYEEAVSSYQKAVELDPTFTNAYENL